MVLLVGGDDDVAERVDEHPRLVSAALGELGQLDRGAEAGRRRVRGGGAGAGERGEDEQAEESGAEAGHVEAQRTEDRLLASSGLSALAAEGLLEKPLRRDRTVAGDGGQLLGLGPAVAGVAWVVRAVGRLLGGGAMPAPGARRAPPPGRRAAAGRLGVSV